MKDFLIEMELLVDGCDEEVDHCNADDLLCEYIIELGGDK